MKSKTNIPTDPCRWSLQRAAEEFDIDSVTLRKRFVKADISPDPVTGCYLTSQVIQAIFEDSKALRDWEVKEKATNWNLKNQVMRGELLNRADVERGLEASYSAIAQIIKGSSLNAKEQKSILNELSNCPVTVKEVARAQSSQTDTKEDV